ncbi:MAG: 3-deoxy-D-manno-octulosonic acid transferase, partial [Candidatus Nephrothrix sp. EaCA]
TMVIGSCHPKDMEVLIPFINNNKNLKFIIAPHEISEDFMSFIESALTRNVLRYSKAHAPFDQAEALLADQIGLLSRLYRYGEYAFVGGAFGKGLHNILEAACYGAPVFFGNKKYKKFQEATDLIRLRGAFSVKSYDDLQKQFDALCNHPEKWTQASRACIDYVRSNTGSAEKILNGCQPYLS